MGVNVLMVGTGEYTTGWVHDQAAQSDKRAGVVALTIFDLRSRGWVDRVLMAGTQGVKFPAIRRHLQAQVGDTYRGMACDFESYPPDDVTRELLALVPVG